LLKKADIFSLGLTILKLMKGRDLILPAHGHNWEEIRNGELFFID